MREEETQDCDTDLNYTISSLASRIVLTESPPFDGRRNFIGGTRTTPKKNIE